MLRATQTITISSGWPTRWWLFLARLVAMLHTCPMTMPDIPERPGQQASETRQMVERGRTETSAQVSNPAFLIALAVIVAVIVAFALFVR